MVIDRVFIFFMSDQIRSEGILELRRDILC